MTPSKCRFLNQLIVPKDGHFLCWEVCNAGIMNGNVYVSSINGLQWKHNSATIMNGAEYTWRHHAQTWDRRDKSW